VTLLLLSIHEDTTNIHPKSGRVAITPESAEPMVVDAVAHLTHLGQDACHVATGHGTGVALSTLALASVLADAEAGATYVGAEEDARVQRARDTAADGAVRGGHAAHACVLPQKVDGRLDGAVAEPGNLVVAEQLGK